MCRHGPLQNFGSLIIICFTKDVVKGGCYSFPDDQLFKVQNILAPWLGSFVVATFINIDKIYYLSITEY